MKVYYTPDSGACYEGYTIPAFSARITLRKAGYQYTESVAYKSASHPQSWHMIEVKTMKKAFAENIPALFIAKLRLAGISFV